MVRLSVQDLLGACIVYQSNKKFILFFKVFVALLLFYSTLLIGPLFTLDLTLTWLKLIICRCCQQLWNYLPPMTELFVLVSCNILINMESRYQHKLLMNKYAVNDTNDFNVFNNHANSSYFSSIIYCFSSVEILKFHLVFATRFTLMLLPGSLTHLLSFVNWLLNPCLLWLLRFVHHIFWF